VNWLWIAPLILALDQATKLMVAGSMAEGQSIAVLGDFFRLTFIHNRGAAFGINVGSPLLHLLFSLGALGALGWMFHTAPPEARLLRCSLSTVLGGALGNIVDRVRLEKVVDFFDFGLGDLRWPVFNVADTFVTIGICLLILTYSRHQEQEAKTPAPDPQPPGNLA
jgi:signal peptidase II